MAPPTVEDLKEKYRNLFGQSSSTQYDRSCEKLTIYQYLEEIHASHFLELLKQCPELETLLKATDKEHTLFLATEASWRALVEATGDDVSETREQLCMHISPHYITIPDGVLHMNNVPTLLRPQNCNGPQVLSTKFEGRTWTVGSSGAVFKENIACANGLVHHINNLATIPVSSKSVLETYRLGFFLKVLEQMPQDFLKEARTIFAPSDQAFQELGDENQHLLFHTPAGKSYLQALVQYHCVADRTIFTNLIWPKNDTGNRMTSKDAWKDIKGQQIQTVPTMLTGEASHTIALTVTRCNRVIDLTINDTTKVLVPDLTTSEGVIHIVDQVLLLGNGRTLEHKITNFMEHFRPPS